MAASILLMCIAYLIIVVEAGPCKETQHCLDCDNTTGHCLTECDTGYFDQMCSSVCSDNCKNQNCILVGVGIGNCTEGCVPGYQGRGCNIPCDSPGGNCTACPGGCDGGYCQLGSFCVSGCVDSNYGTDCDEKSGGNMYAHIGLVASALFLNFCIFVTIYTSFILYMNKKREERNQEDEDIYLPNLPAEERVAPDAFRHSNARYSEVNDNDMGTVVVFL